MKKGLYYSEKYDTMTYITPTNDGASIIFAQWTEMGVWFIDKEGYVFGFVGNYNKYNFNNIINQFNFDYINDISYLEFVAMVHPMMVEGFKK